MRLRNKKTGEILLIGNIIVENPERIDCGELTKCSSLAELNEVWDENAPLLSHEFGYSEDCIFEQYTGLKDKNSKEIYEGDIVYDIYTGDEVFIVGWDKDKASFMLADTADYPMAYFDEYELDKDLEVIGNIHENKELWSESV